MRPVRLPDCRLLGRYKLEIGDFPSCQIKLLVDGNRGSESPEMS